MPDVALVVDFDDVYAKLRQKRLPVSPESFAQDLSRAAKFLGRTRSQHLRAIADWHEQPAALLAFQRAGFTTLPASGVPNRTPVALGCPSDADDLLGALAGELELLAGALRPTDVLVLVSSRAELEPLIRDLSGRCDLRVWGVEGAGLGSLDLGAVPFLALEEALGLKVKRQVLVIDFENISRTLADLGYRVDIDQLIRSFKEQAHQGGELVRAYAYADWWKLPPIVRSNGTEAGEVATIFELHGIQTRNTPSLGGKNAADMRIVEDVHAIMNSPRPPDTLILASGDRDFASLVQELQTLGAEVVVWGVRGKTSRALEQVASRLEYIQDFVPLAPAPRAGAPASAEPQPAPAPGPAGGPPEGEASGPPLRPGRLAQLVLFTDRLMQRNRWVWAWQGVLINELAKAGDFGSEEEAKTLLLRAIEEGVMVRQQVHRPTASFPDRWVWACRPNEEHPVVRATRLIPQRALALVREDLELMPYVAFSRLKERLAGDPALQQPWLRLDDPARTEWISFLGQVGVLKLGKRPHHRNPRDLVTFIVPAEGAESGPAPGHPSGTQVPLGTPPAARAPSAVERANGDEAAPPAGTAAPAGVTPPAQSGPPEAAVAAMFARIVVAVDHFIRRSGWGWAPLRSLRHRLQPFGRAELDVALNRAQAAGDLTLQAHENPDPQKPHTTGVHLGDSAAVRAVLEWRDRIVLGLAAAQAAGEQLSQRTVAELLERHGGQPDQARLWLSILEFEQVVRPVDPPWVEERHYLLASESLVVQSLLGQANEAPAPEADEESPAA